MARGKLAAGAAIAVVAIAVLLLRQPGMPIALGQQPTPTAPAGAAIERVLPVTQTVSMAQGSFSVDVSVEDVSGLGAYDVLLTYDSARVAFLTASDGPFLTSTGRSAICPPPVIQTLTGTLRKVHFGCGTLGLFPPGASGAGTLATVQFAPLAPGSMSLDLEPSLSTTLGDPIAAVAYAGSVSIDAGPTQTPTRTFTPVPTSTPCAPAGCPTPTPALCAPTSVGIDPTAIEGHPGVVADVPIGVQNACDVGGFQVTLSYDASLLTYAGIDPGQFLGSSGRSVQCAAPQLLPGAVRLSCVTLGLPPPGGASGSGVLAVAHFVPGATGTSALTLTDTILVTPDATRIDATTVDASISVTACASCTTVTPTPSPPSTLTPTATRTPSPTSTATACGGTCPTASATSTPVVATATSTAVVQAASVRIEPASLTGSQGSVLDVPVAITGAVNVGAFHFTLSWDPAVLSFELMQQDVSLRSAFLESSGRSSFCAIDAYGASSVAYTCTTLGAALGGASGSGVLMLVRLTPVAAGTTPLALSQVLLTTPSAQTIPLGSVQVGSATISPCGSGCPSATATATAAATSTPSSGTTSVNISPASFDVSPGDMFTVDVLVSNVANLGAFQFAFDYNASTPLFIDYVSVQPGAFLGSTGRPVFCPPPTVNAFTVHFGCATSGTSALGANGSGVLARLAFSVSNFGTNSLFGVSSVDLSDPLGDSISALRGPLGTVSSQPAPAAAAAVSGSGGGAQLSQFAAQSEPVAALSGDVNGDCAVNIVDDQDLALRYGARSASAQYVASRDLQPSPADGSIDIRDVQFVFGRNGSRCGGGGDAIACPAALPDQADNDGAGTAFEWIKDGAGGASMGADSCDEDDDNSGCSDLREPWLSPPRDPKNPWDFADMWSPALPTAGSRNGAITIGDVISLLAWVGTQPGGAPNSSGRQYDSDTNANGVADGAEYDRSPAGALSGPPNGAVSIGDALVVLGQVGDAC